MPTDPLLRLPVRFVLTIKGCRYRWTNNPVPHDEMARMLTRLFAGETASRGTFARWQMEVTIEPDTDQGPEGVGDV